METAGRRRNSGQPSDRRADLVRTARATVRLRDPAVQSAGWLGQPRHRAGCELFHQSARGLHLSHDRQRVRAMAGRRHDLPGEHGEHHYDPRQNGALYHPDRDGHHQPGDLPDHDPARSAEGPGAELELSTRKLEQTADLHLWRRLHRRLVPAGSSTGA